MIEYEPPWVWHCTAATEEQEDSVILIYHTVHIGKNESWSAWNEEVQNKEKQTVAAKPAW